MSLFFPRRCPLCDQILEIGKEGICSQCETKIEYVREPYCVICGKPLFEEGEELCEVCRGKEMEFKQGHALFVYNRSIQESIVRFKYHGRQEYAAFYARELYERYGEWMQSIGAQVLIPVPIHRKRRKKRGYNQAELIAEKLAEYSGMEVCCECLERCKNTLPQKELSEMERKKNLEDAFSWKSLPQELNQVWECAILLDDIYTTGSTINACAQILKKQGVERIYFLCVSIGKG